MKKISFIISSLSLLAGEIREVFPVAVVHEPVLRFGLAAHAVVTEFAADLPGLAVRADLKIHRLQLIEIEELERLEPYLRDHDFTLAECLRVKVHDDPDHRMGFWQFVTTNYLPAHGIASKSNARLAGIFGWLAEAASWRVYRGDYFDPVVDEFGSMLAAP